MKIKCSYNALVEIDKLILLKNTKNINQHPKEQIERLSKIIDFAGQRSPIVISNRSGFIVKGHARLHAIAKLGWEKAAVDYQDYDTEAAEYQDMTADNEIARWAEFNKVKFLEDVKDLDLGDLELLGLKNIDDLFKEKEQKEDKEEYIIVINCSNKEEQEELFDRLKAQNISCKMF
jgi:hypothetical protein